MTKRPMIAVDGVLIRDRKILLVRRGKDPFKGYYALPGGFVEYGETVENAVVREVLEETGIKTRVKELLGVYSDPNRDPRGHVISIAFLLEYVEGEPRGGDDAEKAQWFDLEDLPNLAFDHDKIIRDARRRLGV
ncbi:MAG: ADP-ribose pyrophosphatase [Thermoplasmata archaeon]|nr:MAG: ADP-ribose pyrophosphatase [Thermoplasmata archaeon]